MLNPNHKSSLQATFHTIDEALSRAGMLLDSSREQSPFSELAPDATPLQRDVIGDYATRIRAAMQSVLEHYGIPPTHAQRSSLWSARVAMLSSAIALEEVQPNRLRGFGEISADDARDLMVHLTPIRELLYDAQSYLTQECQR